MGNRPISALFVLYCLFVLIVVEVITYDLDGSYIRKAQSADIRKFHIHYGIGWNICFFYEVSSRQAKAGSATEDESLLGKCYVRMVRSAPAYRYPSAYWQMSASGIPYVKDVCIAWNIAQSRHCICAADAHNDNRPLVGRE